MSRLPTFDPRTVSREMLMERAGIARPATSIIVFSDGPDALDVAIDAQGEATGRLQVIEARGPSSGDDAEPDESVPILANRAASNAIGKVLVLIFGKGKALGEELAALIGRLETEPALGVVTTGLSLGHGPWGATGAVAVRGDVWSALGGFEEAYESLSMALRDLCMRARAIGFQASDPMRLEPADRRDAPDADRRLLEERAALAPDRSERRPAALEDGAGKVVVYTSIVDCYDILKPQPQRIAAGADLVAFLDGPTATAHKGRSRGWRIVDHAPVKGDPQRASRFYKVNAQCAFPDAPVTLWVDASISLVFPFSPARLVDLFLADADICVFRHYTRRSIYEEAEACKQAQRDRPEIIDAQIARYRAEALPEDSGLAELPVILRRNTPATRAFNEAWWAEIMAGSRRDQLSFNYVAWKHGLRYATFPLSLPAGNGLFVKFQR